MSKYLGDIAEDAIIYDDFTTTDSTGDPTTLSGTPVLSVYKDDNTTQSVAGITLIVDFDSVTGLNNWEIDTSADAFYATGSDYKVVITTGTVDGTPVVGYVVATFSIENRFDNGVSALNDFDPANDDVAVVTLVNTTTASTNAETAIGNLNDIAAPDVTDDMIADARWLGANSPQSMFITTTIVAVSLESGTWTSGTITFTGYSDRFGFGSSRGYGSFDGTTYTPGAGSGNSPSIDIQFASMNLGSSCVLKITDTAGYEQLLYVDEVTAETDDAFIALADGRLALWDSNGLFPVSGITIPTVTEVVNEVDADVTAVSGSPTAADNLKAQYDGVTGLLGNKFPARQDQLASISGGLAVRENVDTATSIQGTPSGSISDMNTINTTYYTITDGGSGIEEIFKISPSDPDSHPGDTHFAGYFNDDGAPFTDTADLRAYNFEDDLWDDILVLAHGTANEVHDVAMSAAHRAPTSETIETVAVVEGDVLVKAASNDTDAGNTFNIDLLQVGFIRAAATAEEVWAYVTRGLTEEVDADITAIDGSAAAATRLKLFSEYQSYQDRRAHIDIVSGSAGTTDHENATLLNPSSVWADALSVAASLNLTGFQMYPGSSITLTQDQANNIFHGESWTFIAAGYDLSNSYIYDAFVFGSSSTSDTQNSNFTRCYMYGHTLGSSVLRECYIGNDLTLSEAGNYILDNCREAFGTQQAGINYSSLGGAEVQIDSFSGVIEIKNMAAGDELNLYGTGGLIINASCSGGDINRIGGNFFITDNASGAVTITNQVARFGTDQVSPGTPIDVEFDVELE